MTITKRRMTGGSDAFSYLNHLNELFPTTTRYELKDLDVWQSLLSMLFKREDEEKKDGSDLRHAALQMTEILMKREPRYVASFVQKGGLGSIRDLLAACADRKRVKLDKDVESETSKLKVIFRQSVLVISIVCHSLFRLTFVFS